MFISPIKVFKQLLIIGWFTSCSIPGKYQTGDGFNNATLRLFSNKTFTYQTFQDVAGRSKITGSWYKKNNSIVLNSDAIPPFQPNTVITKYDSSLKRKLLIVQNMDAEATGTIVSINDGQLIDTLGFIWDYSFPDSFRTSQTITLTGIYFDIDTVKKISLIESLGWRDCILTKTTFDIDSDNINLIRIIAQPYNLYLGMKYMVNTEWLFQNNKIYYWKKIKEN